MRVEFNYPSDVSCAIRAFLVAASASLGEFYRGVVDVDLSEVERRLNAGDRVVTIAADLGVTTRTIRNHLHAAGLPLRSQRSKPPRPDPPVREIRPENRQLTADALTAAFGAGATVSEIARRAGVDRSTVRRAMRRHGVTNPHADWGRRPVLLDDADWLRRRYVDELQSQRDIANEVGAAEQTVRRALERHGIERPAGIARRIKVDPVWLEQVYAVEQLPLAEIASQAGVNVSTIDGRLHEYGIPKRPPIPQPPRERPKTDRPGGLDPVWLRRRYLDEKATMVQLGREVGVSATTIYRALDFHGLRRVK